MHVPFCARRCSYCDFAIAVRATTPSETFARAVLAEWDTWQAPGIWDGHRIDTIYFGGGTPSRLSPPALARLLQRFRADRPVASDAEITLEANPDDVTASHARAWRAIGVNRISLGAQSFDPTVLQWMHRTHGPDDVSEAVHLLRAEGFDNVSVDLMFGLPAPAARDWDRDLDQALALSPAHISLYGITVEERTPLARWLARGDCSPPDESLYAVEYLRAHAVLTGAGFQHYEVSNAAKPGYRARHNAAYWERVPYIGLGPSAHSFVGGRRQWNLREWVAYQRAALDGTPVVAGREPLSVERDRLETLLLGLRTWRGAPADMLDETQVAAWEAAGWATRKGGRVCLTAEGWLRLDALVRAAA